MSEATITISDLRKVKAEAEAALAKSKQDFEAFASLSTADLLAKLDEVTAAQGAIKRAEANVGKAITAIEDFEANERFERIAPVRDALKDYLTANANDLPHPVVTGIYMDVTLGDDGNFTVEPRLTITPADLDAIRKAVAEALAPHRELMRRNAVKTMFGRLDDIGKPSMVVSVGRVAPKAAKAPAAAKSADLADFEIGQTLTASYKGTDYTCQVTDAGFVVNGETYKSASGAAQAVTGTNVNGKRFWKVA